MALTLRPRCLLVGDLQLLRPMKEAASRAPATLFETRDPLSFDFEAQFDKIDFVFVSSEYGMSALRSLSERAKAHNPYVRITVLDVNDGSGMRTSDVGAHSIVTLTPENAHITAQYWSACLYPPPGT